MSASPAPPRPGLPPAQAAVDAAVLVLGGTHGHPGTALVRDHWSAAHVAVWAVLGSAARLPHPPSRVEPATAAARSVLAPFALPEHDAARRDPHGTAPRRVAVAVLTAAGMLPND